MCVSELTKPFLYSKWPSLVKVNVPLHSSPFFSTLTISLQFKDLILKELLPQRPHQRTISFGDENISPLHGQVTFFRGTVACKETRHLSILPYKMTILLEGFQPLNVVLRPYLLGSK